jgi:hypothetical protein
MKLKTSDLTGAALDWAVAKSEVVVLARDPMGFGDGSWWTIEHTPFQDTPKQRVGFTYSPSTNWAQGGPIIEREGIATLPCPRGWAARVGFGGEYIEGPTPLIAAMRCFVASKLGDEVDVPEELA